jgi:hypothetical protein
MEEGGKDYHKMSFFKGTQQRERLKIYKSSGRVLPFHQPIFIEVFGSSGLVYVIGCGPRATVYLIIVLRGRGSSRRNVRHIP